MAEKNIGKITQVISAVLDIKFPQGGRSLCQQF